MLYRLCKNGNRPRQCEEPGENLIESFVRQDGKLVTSASGYFHIEPVSGDCVASIDQNACIETGSNNGHNGDGSLAGCGEHLEGVEQLARLVHAAEVDDARAGRLV